MLRAVRRRFHLLSLCAALIAASLLGAKTSSTYDIMLPGPAPREHPGPVAGIGLPKDDRCGDCHAEIAAEWKESLHRRAWDNEYFARAYTLEPLAFCRGCHAPLADSAAEPPPEAQHVGVGCTSCHVVSAGIVGTHALAAQENGHEVIGDSRLGTSAACGRCHDFAFPGSRLPEIDRMQKTMHEHAVSAHSTKSCQECHMPLVPSQKGPAHHKHDFRVMGDRDFMARAVLVNHSEIKDDALHLELALGTIGHAFPTGDLYRRVDVRAFAIDTKGKTMGNPSSHVLRRVFGPAFEGPNKPVPIEREDGRLNGQKHIVLPLPKGTTRARYEIVWQRLPPEMAKKFGMNMRDQEMIVIEGLVTK